MKRLYAPHMLYGYAASLGLIVYATISGAGSYDCGKTSEIPLAECQALVELYDATEGDKWVGHDGWLTVHRAVAGLPQASLRTAVVNGRPREDLW